MTVAAGDQHAFVVDVEDFRNLRGSADIGCFGGGVLADNGTGFHVPNAGFSVPMAADQAAAIGIERQASDRQVFDAEAVQNPARFGVHNHDLSRVGSGGQQVPIGRHDALGCRFGFGRQVEVQDGAVGLFQGEQVRLVVAVEHKLLVILVDGDPAHDGTRERESGAVRFGDSVAFNAVMDQFPCAFDQGESGRIVPPDERFRDVDVETLFGAGVQVFGIEPGGR